MRMWLRGVAMGTLLCFLATQTVSAAPGASIDIAGVREAPLFLSLDIPAELATIDELYEAPNQSDPKFILHIQDAHANYDAQTKIKKLLAYLKKQYAINTVFVEGASEKLDADYIRLFQDEANNLKLADALAKQGELSGTELFMLEAGKDFEALGIEDPKLYRENYEALKAIFRASDEVDRFFTGFDGKLGQVGSKVFTPEVRELLADWKQFEKGHREFLPFVKKLVKAAKRVLHEDLESLFAQVGWPQISRLLVIQMMEKDLNQKKALAERDALVKFLREKRVSRALVEATARFQEGNISVGRSASGKTPDEIMPRYLLEQLVAEAGPKGFRFSNYPNFSLFAGYVVLKGELDAKALFSEIEYLLTKMLDTLVEEATPKRLLDLYRDGELFRKLLYLELDRSGWKKVQERRGDFAIDPLVARLKDAVASVKGEGGAGEQQVMPPEFSKRMTELTATGFKFYKFACQREEVFFAQMQKAMAERNIRKAVVVTGGFHTSGLSDLFRENETSYGIVTPRLSEKSDEKLYKTSMLQNQDHPFVVSYIPPVLEQMPPEVQEAMGVRSELRLANKIAAGMDLGFNLDQMLEEVNGSAYAKRSEIRLEDTGEKDSGGRRIIRIISRLLKPGRTEEKIIIGEKVAAEFGRISPAPIEEKIVEKKPFPTEITTILALDDEQPSREMVQGYLEGAKTRGNADFNVITVKSGAEALDVLRKEKVDLFLTDVDLGEKDPGYEVARKAVETGFEGVVIIMTGNTSIEKEDGFKSAVKKMAEKIPFVGLAYKPMSFRSFIDFLREPESETNQKEFLIRSEMRDSKERMAEEFAAWKRTMDRRDFLKISVAAGFLGAIFMGMPDSVKSVLEGQGKTLRPVAAPVNLPAFRIDQIGKMIGLVMKSSGGIIDPATRYPADHLRGTTQADYSQPTSIGMQAEIWAHMIAEDVPGISAASGDLVRAVSELQKILNQLSADQTQFGWRGLLPWVNLANGRTSPRGDEIAFVDNVNLSASLMLVIGSLLRFKSKYPAMADRAANLIATAKQFLDNQKAGYQAFYDAQRGLFYGSRRSSGFTSGYYIDRLFAEHAGKTAAIVAYYGLPLNAFTNLIPAFRSHKFRDGKTRRVAAPWDGGAFQMGWYLPFILSSNKFRTVTENFFKAAMDYSYQRGIPGLLSASLTAHTGLYEGKIGYPFKETIDEVSHKDGSLYALDGFYNLSPKAAEAVLAWRQGILAQIPALNSANGNFDAADTQGNVAQGYIAIDHLSSVLGLIGRQAESFQAFLADSGKTQSMNALLAKFSFPEEVTVPFDIDFAPVPLIGTEKAASPARSETREEEALEVIKTTVGKIDENGLIEVKDDAGNIIHSFYVLDSLTGSVWVAGIVNGRSVDFRFSNPDYIKEIRTLPELRIHKLPGFGPTPDIYRVNFKHFKFLLDLHSNKFLNPENKFVEVNNSAGDLLYGSFVPHGGAVDYTVKETVRWTDGTGRAPQEILFVADPRQVKIAEIQVKTKVARQLFLSLAYLLEQNRRDVAAQLMAKAQEIASRVAQENNPSLLEAVLWENQDGIYSQAPFESCKNVTVGIPRPRRSEVREGSSELLRRMILEMNTLAEERFNRAVLAARQRGGEAAEEKYNYKAYDPVLARDLVLEMNLAMRKIQEKLVSLEKEQAKVRDARAIPSQQDNDEELLREERDLIKQTQNYGSLVNRLREQEKELLEEVKSQSGRSFPGESDIVFYAVGADGQQSSFLLVCDVRDVRFDPGKTVERDMIRITKINGETWHLNRTYIEDKRGLTFGLSFYIEPDAGQAGRVRSEVREGAAPLTRREKSYLDRILSLSGDYERYPIRETSYRADFADPQRVQDAQSLILELNEFLESLAGGSRKEGDINRSRLARILESRAEGSAAMLDRDQWAKIVAQAVESLEGELRDYEFGHIKAALSRGQIKDGKVEWVDDKGVQRSFEIFDHPKYIGVTETVGDATRTVAYSDREGAPEIRRLANFDPDVYRVNSFKDLRNLLFIYGEAESLEGVKYEFGTPDPKTGSDIWSHELIWSGIPGGQPVRISVEENIPNMYGETFKLKEQIVQKLYFVTSNLLEQGKEDEAERLIWNIQKTIEPYRKAGDYGSEALPALRTAVQQLENYGDVSAGILRSSFVRSEMRALPPGAMDAAGVVDLARDLTGQIGTGSDVPVIELNPANPYGILLRTSGMGVVDVSNIFGVKVESGKFVIDHWDSERAERRTDSVPLVLPFVIEAPVSVAGYDMEVAEKIKLSVSQLGIAGWVYGPQGPDNTLNEQAVIDLKNLGYEPKNDFERIDWLLASEAEGYPQLKELIRSKQLGIAAAQHLWNRFVVGVGQAGSVNEATEAVFKDLQLVNLEQSTEVGEETFAMKRETLAGEVAAALDPRTKEKLESLRPEFELASSTGIVSQIVVPGDVIPAAEEVASALQTLVALKTGELNWDSFLSLAQSLLRNPALAVSEAEGATIIAVSEAPSEEELENALMQLAMNTGQRVRYVLENISDGRQKEIKSDIRAIQGALDIKGSLIGRRIEIAFVKPGQKVVDVVKSMALQMGNENAAFKGGNRLTLLVAEGMATKYGPMVGTIMESWKDAGAKFAAVRNLLAMKAAQMNLSTKDAAAAALLNKQIGDNAIVQVPNAYYFGIDGSKLSALAKLWEQVMSIRATSVAA